MKGKGVQNHNGEFWNQKQRYIYLKVLKARAETNCTCYLNTTTTHFTINVFFQFSVKPNPLKLISVTYDSNGNFQIRYHICRTSKGNQPTNPSGIIVLHNLLPFKYSRHPH